MLEGTFSQVAAQLSYFSATDTVWCVDTVPIGTTNYVMVFNGGESEATIDNIVVYRFACFVSFNMIYIIMVGKGTYNLMAN